MDDEYFSVTAKLRINVEPLNEKALPNMADFINEIPPAFLIARQCTTLDVKSQKDIAEISDTHCAFARLIMAQNAKIDLLLRFMLAQHKERKHNFETHTFGASGLDFFSDHAFKKGQGVRLHIFLVHPLTAVYCYGKITQSIAIDGKFKIKAQYVLLQEEDRDVLIRAALFHQQQLLRKRAKERQE